MRRDNLSYPFLFLAMLTPLSAQQFAPWRDPSHHAVQFVAVEKDVRLEVLDWGGSGRSVILLAGGGNTAHVFDEFAEKLTTGFHVFGITRRGFGESDFSRSENAIDRLRDDVLTVIDKLKLERPALVGHSIAGAELSAIATSHPERVAGLVYLEAGYPYAFGSGKGPTMKDFQIGGPQPPAPNDSDLSSFSALQKWDAKVYGFRIPEAEFRQTWSTTSDGQRPAKARDFPGAQAFMEIMTKTKTYTDIPVPALVMFAIPNVQESWIDNATDTAVREEARTYYTRLNALKEQQAKAFEVGVPSARVVRLQGMHYIFLSNETEVLREMRAFLSGLK